MREKKRRVVQLNYLLFSFSLSLHLQSQYIGLTLYFVLFSKFKRKTRGSSSGSSDNDSYTTKEKGFCESLGHHSDGRS